MNDSFTAQVRNAFGFLLQAGFEFTAIDPRTAVFRSTDVLVSVGRNDRSGEIDVTFALVDAAGRDSAYSLYDLLAMQGQVGRSGAQPPQIFDAARVSHWLELMADDCRDHAAAAIAGNRDFFRSLEEFRHAEASRITRELELRQIRSEIEKAWLAKEMGKVAFLYDSIDQDLDAAEKLKRDYARKHSRS